MCCLARLCCRKVTKVQSMRGQHRRRFCCYYFICVLVFPYILLRVGRYYHVIDKNFPQMQAIQRALPKLDKNFLQHFDSKILQFKEPTQAPTAPQDPELPDVPNLIKPNTNTPASTMMDLGTTMETGQQLPQQQQDVLIGAVAGAIDESSMSISPLQAPPSQEPPTPQPQAAPLPAMDMQAPVAGIPAPAVGIQAPAVGIQAPVVGIQAPAVGIQAPAVGIQAPEVGVQAPVVGASDNADALAKGILFNYDSKRVLINPKIRPNDKMVIAIISAPDNFQQRMDVRNSWKIDATMNPLGITVLFFLGKTGDNVSLQTGIANEANNFNDVVQMDFEDTYRNLTLKTYGIVRWFSLYTLNAKYLLKVDDDTFVNIINLVKSLPPEDTKVMVGFGHMRVKPIRDAANVKYYVDETVYPEPTYPPYLAGGGYLMTRIVAIKINNLCRYAKLMPMEDIFITGICGNIAGIRRKHEPSFRSFRHPPGHECVFLHRVLVAQVKASMIVINQRIKQPELANVDCSKHY